MGATVPPTRSVQRASFFFALVTAATVAGCGAHVYHVVQKGETLYSISFRHGRDFEKVAQWNGIDPPYTIRAGQRIRIVPPHGHQSRAAQPQPAMEAGSGQAAPAPAANGAQPAQSPRVASWQWPIGNLRAQPLLKVSSNRRGLDIAGKRGEPVRAAADGTVVYSGAGIPHYGQLLIIKHDSRFLSAYAHNERLLVREGQHVLAGQQVAEMGDSGIGTDAVKLHFEIRADGVPVDPLKYLPAR